MGARVLIFSVCVLSAAVSGCTSFDLREDRSEDAGSTVVAVRDAASSKETGGAHDATRGGALEADAFPLREATVEADGPDAGHAIDASREASADGEPDALSAPVTCGPYTCVLGQSCVKGACVFSAAAGSKYRVTTRGSSTPSPLFRPRAVRFV